MKIDFYKTSELYKRDRWTELVYDGLLFPQISCCEFGNGGLELLKFYWPMVSWRRKSQLVSWEGNLRERPKLVLRSYCCADWGWNLGMCRSWIYLLYQSTFLKYLWSIEKEIWLSIREYLYITIDYFEEWNIFYYCVCFQRIIIFLYLHYIFW